MKLIEIKNDDPDLFIHIVRGLLKKGDQVFYNVPDGDSTFLTDIDKIEISDGDVYVHYSLNRGWCGEEWCDLQGEWTVTKINDGGLIHEVD